MPVELFCAVAGDQAQQHVADVGDGRVGQQPLQVVLRDGRQVAAGHGGDGDEDQQRHVHRAQRIEPEEEDAQQHRPARGLHRNRHESGDAGGRAFVGVGRPLMERHRRDLEQQAGRGRQQREDRRPDRWDGRPGSPAASARSPSGWCCRSVRRTATGRRRRFPTRTRPAADTSARLRSSACRGAGSRPARRSRWPSTPGR